MFAIDIDFVAPQIDMLLHERFPVFIISSKVWIPVCPHHLYLLYCCRLLAFLRSLHLQLASRWIIVGKTDPWKASKLMCKGWKRTKPSLLSSPGVLTNSRQVSTPFLCLNFFSSRITFLNILCALFLVEWRLHCRGTCNCDSSPGPIPTHSSQQASFSWARQGHWWDEIIHCLCQASCRADEQAAGRHPAEEGRRGWKRRKEIRCCLSWFLKSQFMCFWLYLFLNGWFNLYLEADWLSLFGLSIFVLHFEE